MTQGQTPPGWYDDGHGQLRYFDGVAWTEHTSPLPQAGSATPPASSEPAAPATAAAPAAAVGAAGAAAAGGAAMTTGAGAHGQPASGEPTPIYRKPWFLVLIGVLVLALIAGAIALASGGDDDPSSTAAPTTSSSPTGQAYFGADPSTVAASAGCLTGSPTATSTGTPLSSATPGVTTSPTTLATTTPTPITSAPTSTAVPTQGAAPTASTTCTLNGTTYTVVTWNTAADQDNPQSLANAFPPPITPGTKYYASGNGWTAFEAGYTQTGAQAFATAADGTVQAVVVVTEGGTPSVTTAPTALSTSTPTSAVTSAPVFTPIP